MPTLEHKIKKQPILQKYFYDFYLSTHLWWTHGAGKSAYGFENQNILSHDKEQRLNEFCEKTINDTYKKILEELYYCIAREGRHAVNCDYFCSRRIFHISPKHHIFDWKLKEKNKKFFFVHSKNLNKTQRQYLELLIFLLPNTAKNTKLFLSGHGITKNNINIIENEIGDYITTKENRYSPKEKLNHILGLFFDSQSFISFVMKSFYGWFGINPSPRYKRDFYKNFEFEVFDNNAKYTIEVLSKIFSFYQLWNPYYGGKKWHKAAKLWLQLRNAKTYKDKIFLIDQIFDLQHNTGIIFKKEGCKLYQLTKTHLDKRSQFRSGRDFYPFLSLKGKKHAINYAYI